MIELCFFSLDQWEIKIHLLWGKCFNIPHWPRSHSTNRRLQHIEKLSKTYSGDPHLDQTKLNGLLLLAIHGVLFLCIDFPLCLFTMFSNARCPNHSAILFMVPGRRHFPVCIAQVILWVSPCKWRVFLFLARLGRLTNLRDSMIIFQVRAQPKYHVLAVAMRKEVEHMLHNWKIIIFYFIVSFNPAIQST